MKLLQVNTSITRDWKTSISALLQTLRRVKIVIENTFSWGDFDPQRDWGAPASYVLSRARYLKIGKMMWISFHASATLGGAAASLEIVLPYKAKGPAQWGTLTVLNNAVNTSAGVWFVGGEARDLMLLFRNQLAAYVAGVTIISFNTFVEVE